MPGRDRSLDALLDLDGQTLVVDAEGHMARFVEQPRVYDHVHRGHDDEGRPYQFIDAGKLIEDFWAEVERILAPDED